MPEPDLGTVRALICEDEPIALRAMQEYLRDVAWVEVEEFVDAVMDVFPSTRD